MFAEIAFYVSRRCIWGRSFLYFFVLYICSIFEQVFWGFCPKNLDIFVKTAFQDFDGRMFLRKLHSSNYFRNFDGIPSSGFSRLHFTLLHEKFMEIFFSKNFIIFKIFHVSDPKDSKFFVSVSLREYQNNTLRVERNLLSKYILGKVILTYRSVWLLAETHLTIQKTWLSKHYFTPPDETFLSKLFLARNSTDIWELRSEIHRKFNECFWARLPKLLSKCLQKFFDCNGFW